MTTIAASNLVPPSLPSPSLIDLFIFERPELFLILQLIAAAIILWRINQHGMLGKLWWLPLVCVALGVGVLAVGNAVETVRERLMRRTTEFVGTFIGGDRGRVERLLADQFVAEEIPMANGKRGALDAMDHPYVDGIADYSVEIEGGVRDSENAGRTQAAVSVDHTRWGATRTPGIFEFGWRRTRDGRWVITRLEMLRRPL